MKKHMLGRTAALALATGLLLSGCSNINADATVVNINDGEDAITLGYANFMAHYTQSLYDQFYRSYYGDTYWHDDDDTMQNDVKDTVMDDIEEDYLLVKHAADYGVTLSAEDEEKIAAAVDEFFANNSDEAISLMGATRDILTEYLKNETISRRVEDAIKESDEALAAKEAADTAAEAASDDDEDSDDSTSAASTDPIGDYYDSVLDGWKEETDWSVVESQWKKVRFTDLFEQVTSSSDDAEETAE